MRPPSGRMLDSVATVNRPVIGKDANQGTTQAFTTVVASNLPCSYQESSSTVMDFYGQRQTVNSVTVYFPLDPQLVVNDQLVVVNPFEGTVYLVAEGRSTPAARGVLWQVACRRQEQPPP